MSLCLWWIQYIIFRLVLHFCFRTISYPYCLQTQLLQGGDTYRFFGFGETQNETPVDKVVLKQIGNPFGVFLVSFLPRIALTYFGCASVILQVVSKILKIGIQYFPVDSMHTSVQELALSQLGSSLNPLVKVESDWICKLWHLFHQLKQYTQQQTFCGRQFHNRQGNRFLT